MTLRLAWFATARGTSSKLLFERALAAIEDGRLDAEIAVVFCNRERGQSSNTDAFLDTVETAGVPLVMISSGAWRRRVDGELSDPRGELAPWRREFDIAVRDALAPHAPEVGMLAGYMLVASDVLCDWLPLLNLHPAAPGGPIGTWQEVIQELIADRAGESGILLQRATTELDLGPLVTFCRYPIRGGVLDALWKSAGNQISEEDPLFQAIRAEGVRREPVLIIESLIAIADGDVALPAATGPGANVEITEMVERTLAGRDA